VSGQLGTLKTLVNGGSAQREPHPRSSNSHVPIRPRWKERDVLVIT
jgi:hypothetical protein